MEFKRMPSGTKIVNLFDEIGSGRSLLILGEPGSGKTTTLLDLTRELIIRAEQDIDYRIPVVFNLSKKYTEARSAYHHAIELSSQSAIYYRKLGDIEYSEHNYNQAIFNYLRVVEQNPKDNLLRDQIIRTYKEWIDCDHIFFDSFSQRVFPFSRLKEENTLSLKLILKNHTNKTVGSAFPKTFAYFLEMELDTTKRKVYEEESLEILDDILSQLNGNSSEITVLSHFACVYRNLGRDEYAISAFLYAIDDYFINTFAFLQDIDLTPIDIYEKLGEQYFSLNKTDDALLAYLRAVELSLEDISVYRKLSFSLLYRSEARKEFISRVISIYCHAIELNSENTLLYSNLGTIYLEQEYYDDAISAFNKATKLNPKKVSNYENLAQIYLKIKNYEKGTAVYLQAI
jgi:tetratricopeptide (TPR) repeat protein